MILSEKKTPLVLFLFGLILSVVLHFFHYKELPNTARFAGDTLGYQAMAVNMAYGLGPLDGIGYLGVEKHGFDTSEPRPHYYEAQIAVKGEYFANFYRTPIYPLFLGTVYSIIGVKPGAAKQIQRYLVSLCYSLLPLLGYLVWGWIGIPSGLFAAIAGVEATLRYSNVILTEPMIIIAITLGAFALAFFHRKRNFLSALFLGSALGFGVLTKGSLIFMPPIVGFWALYLLYKKKISFAILCTFVLSCSALILGYSAFASYQTGKFVFISTQSSMVLLDGNNEEAAETGSWAPKWRRKGNPYYENAFYNRPEIAEIESASKRVALFYSHHPHLFLPAMIKKLETGFHFFTSLKIILGFLLLGILCRWLPVAALQQIGRETLNNLSGAVSFYLINFVLLSLVLFGYERFTIMINGLLLLQAAALICGFAISVVACFRPAKVGSSPIGPPLTKF